MWDMGQGWVGAYLLRLSRAQQESPWGGRAALQESTEGGATGAAWRAEPGKLVSPRQ
jgi:hypothetical protein